MRDKSFTVWRRDAIARKLHVVVTPEIDRRYPQLRPARVKVTTARAVFACDVDEALG